MTIDHLAVIEAESARLAAAFTAAPAGRIPWSERWTVATVARHVGGTHHVVAQVVEGRPTTDFGAFGALVTPDKHDPGFRAWFEAGTEALLAQLRSAPADDACWTLDESDRTVGFWRRRMANETLVHRWDAEVGAGIDPAPMDAAVAADAVDEHLGYFVRVVRAASGAPGGPSIGLAATDVDDRWTLDLAVAGERVLARGAVDDGVALTLRGPAEALLLFLWGRRSAADLGLDVEGDAAVLDRWTDLVPPM